MRFNGNAQDKRAMNRYKPNGRSREKHNLLVRNTADECNAFGYEVAELLGWSVEKWTRMMRHELPIDEQRKIADMIRKEYGNGSDEHPKTV